MPALSVRALLRMFFIFVLSLTQVYASPEEAGFVSATTPEQIRRQLRRLPVDDIWWSVTGRDMAWNFRNLHLIFPTATVYRHGPVSVLDSRPMPEIGEWRIEAETGADGMSFDEFLATDRSAALGVVILHRGAVVFERYPRMESYEKPVYWSVAKVFVGTLLRILEERGEVDVDRPIDEYLDELASSSLSGIPVRAFLDMATGLDCEDDYQNHDACYYRYSMAIGDGYRTDDAPDDPYDFLKTLEVTKHAPPGTRFSYSGLNTFALAWLVEELTGMPFQDAFTREIWWHIGAEADAAYIAPRYGIPVTHGGFIAAMRDVARFGLLFTPSAGKVTAKPIISREHVEFLLHGGRPELLTNAGMPPPGQRPVRHNVYQWDAVFENGALFKGGWAGQGLYIHPERDVVAVFTGYFRDDAQSEIDLQPILLALLDELFAPETIE